MRRWGIALAILAAVLGLARWAVWYFPMPTFGSQAAERVTYARYSQQYNEAVELWKQGKIGTDYYNDLPDGYTFLAASGTVGSGTEAVFFPLWTGIPDDAGGYWYVEGGASPEGFDMFGMVCRDPIHLEGNWWVCGMREGTEQTRFP